MQHKWPRCDQRAHNLLNPSHISKTDIHSIHAVIGYVHNCIEQMTIDCGSAISHASFAIDDIDDLDDADLM